MLRPGGNLDPRRGRPPRSADADRRPAQQCEFVRIRILESQFLRFCAVGASGYAVNLAAYAALLAAGLHYLAAAAISFLIAAGSNYVWNRTWTFRTSGSPLWGQGARALLVSGLSLGANQLFLLALVAAGAGHFAGQAVAIVLVTPFSFTANKLWGFAEAGHIGEAEPAPISARSLNR
jgi:putative flippase GtrA